MKKLWEIKLDLLYYGIKLNKSLLKNSDLYFYNDYITCEGIFIHLGNDTYVSAKIQEVSPYYILLENDKYYLKNEDNSFEIEVIVYKLPEYIRENKLNRLNLPISNYVNFHIDRARIQPISGCNNNCSFCNLNGLQYILKDIALLDNAFKEVESTEIVKTILISGGSPKLDKESYNYLSTVYKHFATNYNYPIDIMTTPRGELPNIKSKDNYINFLTFLRSLNISLLSVNLELYNENCRQKYIPRKNDISRNDYIKYLDLAVNLLGKEKVKSALIVGLEPLEDTLKGVELLAQTGVRVMLSPYIPYSNIGNKPSIELMKEVLLKSKEITQKYGVDLGSPYSTCNHNIINF